MFFRFGKAVIKGLILSLLRTSKRSPKGLSFFFRGGLEKKEENRLMRSPQAHGDGSIFQESVNKWTAKITLGHSPDGKPIIKKFSAKTRKEVERKLRDFKKTQSSQKTVSPVHFSVQDYFEYWLKTYQFQKLKPLSYDCLEGSV